MPENNYENRERLANAVIPKLPLEEILHLVLHYLQHLYKNDDDYFQVESREYPEVFKEEASDE